MNFTLVDRELPNEETADEMFYKISLQREPKLSTRNTQISCTESTSAESKSSERSSEIIADSVPHKTRTSPRKILQDGRGLPPRNRSLDRRKNHTDLVKNELK